MRFLILNGPNLNLLGTREPEIYGSQTFDDVLAELRAAFPGHQLDYAQSNVEGELINHLHARGFEADGIVFNAGGYTHTSVAIGDAVKAVSAPVVEVHISQVFAREDFRHVSFIGAHCVASISGMGVYGYRAALQFLIDSFA